MCDFKPGDEVVCVFAGPWWDSDLCEYSTGPAQNSVCTVAGLVDDATYGVAVELVGWPGDQFAAECFRKVQRRDLQAWLSTAVDAPEYDKRKVPA
jgi:hypothetical protein